ncbi:MAG: hypothetical protein IKE65_05190 [Clostridia bacterium]|nr:hypothetical protein [Clostridia bacterium]
MEYTFTASTTVPYEIDKVWEVCHKPRDLDFDGTNSNRAQKTQIIDVSDTEWKEKLGDGTFNIVTVTFDEDKKIMVFNTENPNHPGEITKMTLTFSAVEEGTQVDVISYMQSKSKLGIWVLKAANKSGKASEATKQSVYDAIKKAIEG